MTGLIDLFETARDYTLQFTTTHTVVSTSHALDHSATETGKIRIYKTIILPVVLHACETWSLILREEHRLRVFENRVLRRISGLKGGELTGE
jgi:hypothetical protein